MNQKTKKISLYGLLTLGLVLLVLYIAGVDIMPGNIGANAQISLEHFDTASEVLVDNAKRRPRGIGAQRILNVKSGIRDVLISREGYWPYFKQLTISPGETKVIRPFLIPKNAAIERIGSEDSERDALLKLIQENVPPQKSGVLLSADKTVSIWKSGSTLIARYLGEGQPPSFFCSATACTDMEMTFLSTEVPIQNIAFINGRNDLIAVSSGTTVYALELDRRPIQNFQPIYIGTNPRFAVGGDNAVYISDNGELIGVKLGN